MKFDNEFEDEDDIDLIEDEDEANEADEETEAAEPPEAPEPSEISTVNGAHLSVNDSKKEKAPEKSQNVKNTKAVNELPPAEYVSRKHAEFIAKYSGIAKIEDKWNELRSQLNSGLMLHIRQSDIDKYATLDYDYEQREVLKFYLWQNVSEQLIEHMMTKGTYGEMISVYDTDRAADRAAALLEKTTTNITQVLQSYVDSFTAFKDETAKRMEEYKAKINMLEEELNAKSEETDNLKQQIEELNENINREKKRQENEREIERRVNEIIEQRIDERQELERRLMHQNVDNGVKKKHSIFGKKQKEQTAFTMSKPIVFGKREKLPDNFNLSEYMIGRELSAAQMEIITMAVKCGVSDIIIKQMIDSGKSAAQLKQILEMILAKKQAERHADDISEEDIIYDEQ